MHSRQKIRFKYAPVAQQKNQDYYLGKRDPGTVTPARRAQELIARRPARVAFLVTHLRCIHNRVHGDALVP